MNSPSQVSEVAVSEPAPLNSPQTAPPISRQFVFAGDTDSVPAAREQVMQFVREHCWDEADEIDLMLAVQEALANAALHGCSNDPAKQVECSVAIDGSNVTIVVRDPGPGFDVDKIADPAKFGITSSEHGRGIALMRGVVDEVSFAHGGAEVRLRKHLSS